MKSFCLLIVASCCVAVSFALTRCEEHRERELKNNSAVKLVPKCTPEGEYEALQCFEGSSYCMCWHTDGTTITSPSKNLKTCVCHVHRYKELVRSDQGILGNFIPECNSSGTYAKKQCHGSTGYCWCGDEDGKRISEETRNEIEC